MDTLVRLAEGRAIERRVLLTGGLIELPALMLHFPPHSPPTLPVGVRYHGDPTRALPNSYLNKPLVTVDEQPLFGELAIVRTLEKDRWSAVWVDSYHGRGKRLLWRDLPDRSDPVDLNQHPAIAELFDRIRLENTGTGGFFDVLAWRGDDTLFVEYKGAGDRSNANESRWIASALRAGVPPSSLCFVLR